MVKLGKIGLGNIHNHDIQPSHFDGWQTYISMVCIEN